MSKYNRKKLEKLIIIDKLPYNKIGKLHKCSGSNIRKVAQRMGIKLPKRRLINYRETFRKGTRKRIYCLNCNKDIGHKYRNKYCNVSCQQQFQNKIKYKLYLDNPDLYYGKMHISKWLKPFIMKEQNNKCAICKCIPIHNNKKLIFILDHIDGNANNNKRSNLRIVCPNCDTQLPTYKSKNKNSARHYYRYRYSGKLK